MNFYEQLPPRFIYWTPVADFPGQKPIKRPVDATGKPTDPTNPVGGFMDYQTARANAQALGFKVGWSLPEDGSYFLLDLDNCRNPETGEFTPYALEVFKQFPAPHVN